MNLTQSVRPAPNSEPIFTTDEWRAFRGAKSESLLTRHAPQPAFRLFPDYRQRYWEEETLNYQVPHFRLRFVARLLRNMPNRRLLDLGCSSAALKSMLDPDFYYCGCDIAKWAQQTLGPE